MTCHSLQASVTISGTTTTASATYLPMVDKRYVWVTNPSINLVYVTTGKGSATATLTSTPVAPYNTVAIEKPLDHDTVAAITAASTASVVFCVGSNPQE